MGVGCVFQLAKHYDNYGDSKMNERIRLLAGQAGFETEHHKWIFANDNVGEGECHELLEKFAELIVRECAAICQDVDGEDNIDARSGRQDCAVEIREHFGVE